MKENNKWTTASGITVTYGRMNAWSTNPDYHEIVLQAIVDNKLP